METIPNTMMAWTKTLDEAGGFTKQEHPVPSPSPGEVLVKTHSTSVCGTDIHIGSGTNGAEKTFLWAPLQAMKHAEKSSQ